MSTLQGIGTCYQYGKVLYNSKRIINTVTGKEFAPRIGRGGTRIHLQLQKTCSASASSTPASSSTSLPSVNPVISPPVPCLFLLLPIQPLQYFAYHSFTCWSFSYQIGRSTSATSADVVLALVGLEEDLRL